MVKRSKEISDGRRGGEGNAFPRPLASQALYKMFLSFIKKQGAKLTANFWKKSANSLPFVNLYSSNKRCVNRALCLFVSDYRKQTELLFLTRKQLRASFT